MGRLAWSQLRFRTTRLVALLIGMLLATTAFTVLTAASRTSQLRTTGTVSAHFAPAYDILIRPKGARTELETRTGTVQPNFLSGIYGGISMEQYHQVQRIPGVQVAAPIAMVGYTLLVAQTGSSPLPAAAYARKGRQLYRISTTWISSAGTSRITQPSLYQYVTPDKGKFIRSSGDFAEVLPDGRTVITCPSHQYTRGEAPFSIRVQGGDACWSKVNGEGPGSGDTRPSDPGYGTAWTIPVLIAAIDPAAEAKLDGLNHAVTSGSYLRENASDGSAAGDLATFPVLASSTSGLNEEAVTEVQELPSPASPPMMNVRWMTKEASVPGRTVATRRTTATEAYRSLLRVLAGKGLHDGVFGYWSVGSVSYRRTSTGALVPRQVRNSPRVWYAVAQVPPMDDDDSQYREVIDHAPLADAFTGSIASPQLVGTFNPANIKSFDPLSEVPLGAYTPVVAAPANSASRKALHSSDLLPNQNLGGLVSQPIDLITTLSALPALQDSGYYTGNLHKNDPISVIRVRVAGVTGPNSVSLERIKEVAQQIELRTHLDVDIVAGSSPSLTAIDLPAGKFGQPALSLTEYWVRKGVAIAILTAVDKKSVILFGLILVVCVLFVANSASAAIRGRRRELGVLACLGWTRPRLFTAVLGELAAIGLAAGLLGAAAALPLSSALGLHAALGRAALAVPIALAVAVLAGLAPAWLAASAEPVESVRPPVLGVRRARQPRGVTALAAMNVLRAPGRSVIGALSLAVGVAALTMLAALTVAFRGVLVGSLLGNAVAVQVRGVDYVAVIATVALGVLAVVDVIFLSIRERGTELAAIRAFGWREADLIRLVVAEGTIIGLAGSLAGAATGLAAASQFAGQLPVTLYVVAAAAVAAGTIITATAALLPAQALRRLPAAHLLAEE